MPLATELFSEATLRFALLGMATGALTALVALAVVIVYRVSGVLNFAAPALGSLGAFVCYTLRDDHGWATAPALLLGLAAGTALGLLTWAALALLQGTSLLSRLIATLALLSAAQSAMLVIWPEQTSQPASLLPENTVVLFGDVRITEDRLILIGLALVLAVILGLVYRYTLFGLATSAVSESRRVASIARWAPGRIEFVNHLVAGFLAALAAILLAPILTLNGAILSVAILPALAAALVGRFSSFAITVAAALGIGILQSEVSLFQPDLASGMGVSSASLTGLSQAVPLIIILIVATLSGRLRPARGESVARLPLPGSGRISKVPLILGVVVGAVLVFSAESYADALITTFGMSIIVASVVVVSGYAGQLSLCQYALAGFGAWAAARAASDWGVGFPVALVLGVLATIAVGVLVALPAIRTRGVTLAIVTLALALVFSSLIFQNASLTGGFEGIGIKNPELFGWDVTAGLHPQRYAGLLLVVLVLVSLVVANLRVGATGRQMIAVRSNERAAAALGINVVRVKVYAFAVGAGIAAIGGIFLGFREGSVQFANFNVFGSILLVQYAVIGGIGWISGAVAGAAAAPGGVAEQITSEIFPNLDNIAAWIAIFSGIGVVSLLRRAPDGTASMIAKRFGRFFRRTPAEGDAADEAPREIHLEPRARGVDLAVQGITVRFGGVVAVDDVSFSVAPGEVVGLIGPNGAGKTTLLDVITGFTRQQAGTVTLDHQDVSTWTPERRARAGISRSWQAVELFDELTVRENLLVAEERRELGNYARDLVWRRKRRLSDFGQSVVDDLGLRPYLDDHPRTLPHGVTKLVGIARTIISDPAVILLDEPAAGLDADESNELSDLIRRIAARHSVSIVVIEHDIALILKTCDRIVVLDFGEKIAEGSPDVIRRDAAVIHAYLGEPTDADSAIGVDAQRSAVVTALLTTEGLVAGYGDVTIIRDVDLEVRAGEVVALLGPNGAGKTTTILTLAGEIRPRAGRIRCLDLDETTKATHLRARAGMAIVTDERAVFMRMTVAENIRVFRTTADAVVELFPELRDHLERPVALLSGGQQQMLALGLALSRQPSVILADELSLGLAPMLVDRLFEVLRQAADDGAGVLLVEQYVHKAMSIADRVYVMDHGRISMSGTSAELSTRVDEIQSSYLSGNGAGPASA